MKYVIGVDGGGTRNLLRIADLDGNSLAEAKGGPTNICSVSREEVKKALEESMEKALDNTGLNIKDCLFLIFSIIKKHLKKK